MKHTYKVLMNKDGTGGKFHANIELTVSAENEINAVGEAKKRHPELQVCYIEQKT